MLFEYEDVRSSELEQLGRLFSLGEFPHKMPKDGKVTKVLSKSIEMVEQMVNDDFAKLWGVDSEWVKNCNIDCNHSDSFSANCKMIEKMIKCYNLAKQEGFFPRDKKSLPDSFPEFLCNPRTGKSWYLYFYRFGNQTTEEYEQKKWYNEIPKSFFSALRDSGLDWNAALLDCAEGIARLKVWHKVAGKENKFFYSQQNWLCVAMNYDFWSSYISFLSELIGNDTPNKGHFIPMGKTHKAWMKKVGIVYEI